MPQARLRLLLRDWLRAPRQSYTATLQVGLPQKHPRQQYGHESAPLSEYQKRRRQVPPPKFDPRRSRKSKRLKQRQSAHGKSKVEARLAEKYPHDSRQVQRSPDMPASHA